MGPLLGPGRTGLWFNNAKTIMSLSLWCSCGLAGFFILLIGFQRKLTPFSALHHNNKHTILPNIHPVAQVPPDHWQCVMSAVGLLLIWEGEATIKTSANLQLYSVLRRQVLFPSAGAEVLIQWNQSGSGVRQSCWYRGRRNLIHPAGCEAENFHFQIKGIN